MLWLAGVLSFVQQLISGFAKSVRPTSQRCKRLIVNLLTLKSLLTHSPLRALELHTKMKLLTIIKGYGLILIVFVCAFFVPMIWVASKPSNLESSGLFGYFIYGILQLDFIALIVWTLISFITLIVYLIKKMVS